VFPAAFLAGGRAAGVLLLPGLTAHSSQASTAEPWIITSLSSPFLGHYGALEAAQMLYPCNPAMVAVAWSSCPHPLGAATALPSLLCFTARVLTPLPPCSLLLVLACAWLPLIMNLWLSEHSQLSGNSSFTVRPGWG
jgi:hypothetical protein